MATIAYVTNKDGALRASSIAGRWLARGSAATAALVDRFLVAPSTDLARRIDVWIPAGDGALGRFAEGAGRLTVAGIRAPALPVVLVLAVVLAVALGLVSQGVTR